jgi:hypothetical protein
MYVVQVDNIQSDAEQEKLIKLVGRDNDGGGCYIPTHTYDSSWNFKRLERAIVVFTKFCRVQNTGWQIQLIRDKFTS